MVVQPTSSSGAGWRWSHVLQAPHRLGFLLAMVVLAASGSWWALVQLHRLGLPVALTYAVPPSLAHSAVMTFGFIPLFFAGFLFTAGPRWLGMRAPSAGDVSASLLAQAGGWLLWLLVAGYPSARADRPRGTGTGRCGADGDDIALLPHGGRQRCARSVRTRRLIAGALAWGCLCLAGMGTAVLLDAQAAARGLVLSGIWGCVAVVFVAVAAPHDPLLHLQRGPDAARVAPGWVLALMLGTALFEAAAVFRVPWRAKWTGTGCGQPGLVAILAAAGDSVCLRILAALPGAGSQTLLATAASLWAAVMMVWGVRYGNWYGRTRADGRPG